MHVAAAEPLPEALQKLQQRFTADAKGLVVRMLEDLPSLDLHEPDHEWAKPHRKLPGNFTEQFAVELSSEAAWRSATVLRHDLPIAVASCWSLDSLGKCKLDARIEGVGMVLSPMARSCAFPWDAASGKTKAQLLATPCFSKNVSDVEIITNPQLQSSKQAQQVLKNAYAAFAARVVAGPVVHYCSPSYPKLWRGADYSLATALGIHQHRHHDHAIVSDDSNTSVAATPSYLNWTLHTLLKEAEKELASTPERMPCCNPSWEHALTLQKRLASSEDTCLRRSLAVFHNEVFVQYSQHNIDAVFYLAYEGDDDADVTWCRSARLYLEAVTIFRAQFANKTTTPSPPPFFRLAMPRGQNRFDHFSHRDFDFSYRLQMARTEGRKDSVGMYHPLIQRPRC